MESRDAADRAVRATLATFGERIPADRVENIAAHLPEAYATALAEHDGPPEDFSREEFVRRVTERQRYEHADTTPVVDHMQAVTATLADAGLGSELERVREQLPTEFDTLFETEDLAVDGS